ncbi:MAG: YeeE/YedE family protein [Azospirillum sp.]|nr:YeeE/YedE family protein [Azospirillum sp.]
MPFWYLPLAGGVVIGLGAVALMALSGRIAGISGILAGTLPPAKIPWSDWRFAFLAGLVLGPLPAGLMLGHGVIAPPAASLPVMALAGLLVGIGTGLGSGCTSGHGVCGLARLSPRSAVATAVFMAGAAAVVFVVRHG